MGDLRINFGLGTVGFTRRTGADHPLLGGGQLALSMGRRIPFQGAVGAASDSVILGEVASGIFSSDAAGIAYPAGTLWVRTFCNQGGLENDTATWIAVPDTLPVGFTVNNKRNIRVNASLHPAVSGDPDGYFYSQGTYNAADQAADSWPYLKYNVASPTGESTTGKKSGGSGVGLGPIRSADAIWYPHSSTARPLGGSGGTAGNLYPYGPFNYSNAVYGPGVFPAGTAPNIWYLPYSPGWRNVHITFSISAGAAAILPPTARLEVAIDGSGLHTFTAAGCAGGLTQTWDHGPTTQQAAGVLYQTQFRCEAFNDPSGVFSGVTVSLSPRVDIPLPWTCTSGNLVAPGGIVTGSIPGY